MSEYWIIERKARDGTIWHYEDCFAFPDQAERQLTRLRNHVKDKNWDVEFRVVKFVPQPPSAEE